jgi:hypothetical protein
LSYASGSGTYQGGALLSRIIDRKFGSQRKIFIEHELNYKDRTFYADLDPLLKSGSTIKVFGWSTARDQPPLLATIKDHNYRIEAYTFFNFAMLTPIHPLETPPAKPTS